MSWEAELLRPRQGKGYAESLADIGIILGLDWG